MKQVRRLALSFPEAAEQDHHGMASFRVRGKIFATVPDADHLRIMLDPEVARAITPSHAAFEELWWGAKLAGVSVTLAAADHAAVAELLEQAWRRRAPRALIMAYDDD
jgi:hypothetical protein